MTSLQGRVLGPLVLRVAGEPLTVRAPKERLLLALLMARGGERLTPAVLIDELWGPCPPRTARKNLQVYVSALRKRLAGRVSYDGWGYRLDIAEEELDLLGFRRRSQEGLRAMRAGDARTGAPMLAEAVRLWRGWPLEEFADSPLIGAAVTRWTDWFLDAFEVWSEHQIAHGHPAEVLQELDALATRHPGRERLAAARMRALALCGRTSEAIQQFLALRHHLVEEYGVDPDPVTVGFYGDILAGRVRPPSAAAPAYPAPGGPASSLSASAPPCVNVLPRTVGDFTGRAAEIAALTGGRSPVALVTGEGAAGKTTLAVHAGHQMCARFPDGARLVHLGPRTATVRGVYEVQRENLAALGVRIDDGEPYAVVQSAWRAAFSGRRALLVLDDAPGEDAVRAFLPGTDDVRVLVTSRRRLSGLESVRRVELDEFSTSEAEEFLGRLLGRERLAAASCSVIRLLERWGRSPGALRLIGQRLAGLEGRPFAALLDRLVSADCGLDEFVAGDCSLRRTLTTSYDAPGWELRDAFAALGRLPRPPFSDDVLEAAFERIGLDPVRTVDMLLEAGVLRYAKDRATPEVVAHSVRFTMSAHAHALAVEMAGPGADTPG